MPKAFTSDRIRKTYFCWQSMWQRCSNKNDSDYPYYGGRNITICKRWRTFDNFVCDMGEKPDGMSLDRINNNKGYFPKNCRWATASQQANNRRSVHQITWNGITHSVKAWAKQLGIHPSALYQHARKHNVHIRDVTLQRLKETQ